eukprot:Platyproteum_vivax@DN5688_c0_g1_i1.p2
MMINEWAGYGHPRPPWAKVDPNALILESDVVRFPFAILEVKLSDSETPLWVSNLLSNCEAWEVFRFSKFQHGMAFLHRDKIARNPRGVLPHWYAPFVQKGMLVGLIDQSVHINTAAGAEGVPRDPDMLKQHVVDAAYRLIDLPSYYPQDPSTTTQPVRVLMPRIFLPKNLVANERTLCHYVHISLVLGTLAFSLILFHSNESLNKFNSRSSGLALAPITALFVMYSYRIYWKRGNAIKSVAPWTTERLDDPYGPYTVVLLVGIALIFTLSANIFIGWQVHVSKHLTLPHK